MTGSTNPLIIIKSGLKTLYEAEEDAVKRLNLVGQQHLQNNNCVIYYHIAHTHTSLHLTIHITFTCCDKHENKMQKEAINAT